MSPSKRQIVFNWLMADPDFATKTDGYWGGQDDVDRIDALIVALESANDGCVEVEVDDKPVHTVMPATPNSTYGLCSRCGRPLLHGHINACLGRASDVKVKP
jgi:hypothetical protein